jgi:hypothetical protein
MREVHSPKQIFDFLTTHQTYFKRNEMQSIEDMEYGMPGQFEAVQTKSSSKLMVTYELHKIRCQSRSSCTTSRTPNTPASCPSVRKETPSK